MKRSTVCNIKDHLRRNRIDERAASLCVRAREIQSSHVLDIIYWYELIVELIVGVYS